jgi:hypothetical protein
MTKNLRHKIEALHSDSVSASAQIVGFAYAKSIGVVYGGSENGWKIDESA